MQQEEVEGTTGIQRPSHVRQSSAPPSGSTCQSPRSLWTEQQAAAYFSVSTRKFAELRETGLVPEPLVLGPRALRWIPEECEAAARRMPRQGKLAEPAQLLRSRIERMKAVAA